MTTEINYQVWNEDCTRILARDESETWWSKPTGRFPTDYSSRSAAHLAAREVEGVVVRITRTAEEVELKWAECADYFDLWDGAAIAGQVRRGVGGKWYSMSGRTPEGHVHLADAKAAAEAAAMDRWS